MFTRLSKDMNIDSVVNFDISVYTQYLMYMHAALPPTSKIFTKKITHNQIGFANTTILKYAQTPGTINT